MSKSAPAPELGPWPPRFTELKKDIADSYPDFQERATKAWNELLGELKAGTASIAQLGSEVTVEDMSAVDERAKVVVHPTGCSPSRLLRASEPHSRPD